MTSNDHLVSSHEWAKPLRWRWTKRLAVFFAILLGTIQFLIGLYAVITLPPPPMAEESFGLAIMQGAIITAAVGALTGAMLGSLIDVVASKLRTWQHTEESTLQ